MSIYQGKRVLISGGLGFIGSNLARALVHAGTEVTIVDALIPEYGGNEFNVADFRDRVRVVLGDVRDVNTVEPLLEGQDFFFNLAAQTSHVGSMQDPTTDLHINVTAQLAMLESCRRLNPGIRIVYASTRQIYGKPDYLPVDERHPIRPPDVNGINKYAAESYHLLYHGVYGIRSTVLRLTNTYGPAMRIKDARQTFVGVWIRAVLEGSPIRVFGDGTQLRDFTYVDDCVNAFLLAGSTQAAEGKAYNLGGDQAISLADLARLLCDVGREAGLSCSYELVPFPPERKAIDIGNYYGSSSAIAGDTGWSASTDLRSGLSRTISYYREHFARYIGGEKKERPA